MAIFKLSYKLIFGFLAIILFAGGISYYTQGAERHARETISEQAKIMVDSERMAKYNLELFSSAQSYVLHDTELERNQTKSKFYDSFNKLSGKLDELKKTNIDPYTLSIVEKYTKETESNFDELTTVHDAMLLSNDSVAIAELDTKERQILRSIEDEQSKVIGARDTIVGETRLNMNNAAAEAEKERQLSTNLLAVALLFGTLIGSYITYMLARQLTQLRDGVVKVGQGNLDIVLDISSRDEVGELAAAFNKMMQDLKKSHDALSRKAEEVEASKKTLQEKISELQEGKLAIMNMMEDSEELNRELVQAQKKLKENLKELKEMDVKKNQFISIAAHELKTPLTSIHGFSQLLQNRDIAKSAEKREKYLRIMDRETARLAKLVNDILDLSRVDLGTVTFDIEEVDINKVIESVRTEMNVQMKQKRLNSEYNIASNLPKIYTDRERLAQILLNLINNAVKYTPKGKITISAFKEGAGVHFIIKDTGIGISKANQPKIFTRFYQVDSSYTRSAGGVGLGLSLCKELVELLGGRIWFVSVPGEGSEFHFTLPAKSSANGAKKAGKETSDAELLQEISRKVSG